MSGTSWPAPPSWRIGARACLALGAALTLSLFLFSRGIPGDAAMAQRSLDGMWIALACGLLLFSLVAAMAYFAARRRCARLEADLGDEIARLRARLDRAEALTSADTLVAAWVDREREPEMSGNLALLADGAASPPRLAFDTAFDAGAAAQIEASLRRLRTRGEPFHSTLETRSGRHLEIEGRPSHGAAVMRVTDVSERRSTIATLEQKQSRTCAELECAWALLDAIPHPAWMRDPSGRLSRVNAAYARAVEASDPADAVARGIELLERQTRAMIVEARGADPIWRGRAAAIAVGERKLFDIIDARAGAASVGMAMDVSEMQAARDALEREMQAHARTLDQLSTAVAIFDRSKQLVFHNAAYRQLWGLEQAWLDQRPRDSEILDRLRAARLLPEQADFRAWQATLFAAYQSLETDEQAWHRPDGRTLRVVINPNPQGGVTYVFDDVTERFHLQSQFNAAIRVQSETLETLKEGVAVFGSDGRLKLFNPAFAGLWSLAAEPLAGQPHIDRVAQLCAPLFGGGGDWDELRAAVAGLPDHRTGFETRLSLRDGTVLDCAAAPLPDGATLLTFIDATAGVSVERALTERNQALLDAEKLRNDFVHHVSYELRSPLTNIIGFIQLLGDPAVGPLNPKQLEYAGYVTKSSSALLAIINDILDLASIDADAMELSLEPVDIAETIRAAAEGVQDRLAEANLTLRVAASADLGAFVADAKRIRQILFNLLSNAIGFSAAGQTIDLDASRCGGDVVFEVRDRGRGIAPEMIEQIFDRFKTHTAGSRHRGVGLGLSIVRSFVELHGGRIAIQSTASEGTTVTCIFPASGKTADLTGSLNEQELARHGR